MPPLTSPPAALSAQYYLKLDDEVTWVAASVVLACVVALLVTPLWAWAADRYGRYRVWLLGWLLAAPTGLVNQLVLRPGDPSVGYVWLGAVARHGQSGRLGWKPQLASTGSSDCI